MEIHCWETGQYVITFDKIEKEQLQREARENSMTVIEMFEMILGSLFIGGYKTLIGKE